MLLFRAIFVLAALMHLDALLLKNVHRYAIARKLALLPLPRRAVTLYSDVGVAVEGSVGVATEATEVKTDADAVVSAADVATEVKADVVAEVKTDAVAVAGAGAAAGAVATEDKKALTPAAAKDAVYYPVGTTYCMCSQCKTAYLMTAQQLGRGARVQCGICAKDWYQTIERLMTTSSTQYLTGMAEGKVKEVERILADKNFPRYPRVDKVGVFVGNLPYTYGEKELADLFAEYGLTNISLVTDNEQQSKGFAFLECSSMRDAERMVEEMHYFYAEANRKLTVRLSTPGGGGGGVRSGGVNRGSGQ
mmetsp:Transcript_8526/g.19087  ORF Transcript_8526/g.19087 Transcript_8526/m.19087 type:complete len:306 (+) Transcript_8526:65-982(+)